MRKAILVTGSFWTALGIAYLLYALRYDLGTPAQPGPGLYPILVGAFLTVVAIGTLLSAAINPPSGHIHWPKGAERVRLFGIVAVSVFYALALEYVGYLLCGAIVVLVCLQMMGMQSWRLKIGLTLLMTAVSFFLFDKILSVPLPRGLLYFL
jgi:putative tricarboxylic transport membrane protein